MRRRWEGLLRPVIAGFSAFALLAFASTCALREAACEPAPRAAAAVACDPDGCDRCAHDGGDTHDGCAHGGCAHATTCCSTWEPSPPGPRLDAPHAIVTGAPALAALVGAARDAGSRAPMPTGSPPIAFAVLRL